MRNSELSVERLYNETRKKLKLKLVTTKKGFQRKIIDAELHRPGLVLAGFIDLFTHQRVQILGNTEIHYLNSLNKKRQEKSIKTLLQFEIPCIIVTSGNTVPDLLIELAKENLLSVFTTVQDTTLLHHLISDYLQNIFAEKITMHSTLVDVYGIGLLFTGHSGIGKSEIALDLVERGHRLVADDMVVITKRHEEILMGEGRDITEHMMEIRGLGLIDVKRIYGIWAIRLHKRVEVVIELVKFDSEADYERIGLDEQYTTIMGVKIPLVVLPINPGKNITVIAETIAMNHMLKVQGFNSAEEFNKRLMDRMKKKQNGDRSIRQRGFLDKDFE